MYSIMLYMKTRVTFRVSPDLADSLRDVGNQTQFVEQALRDALRQKCPTCDGTGRVSHCTVRVSNFRRAALPALGRDAALQLREIVALAKRTAATSVDLQPSSGGALGFSVARGGEVLLRGTLRGSEAHFTRN